MSQENAEIVRRTYEAVAGRDTTAILALYDPEVELSFARGTLADHIVGGAAVWTRYEELIDAGDHVVSVSRYRGRGRKSGVEVDGPLQFGVWSFRAGKVTRVSWYSSREEALEAVGLRE